MAKFNYKLWVLSNGMALVGQIFILNVSQISSKGVNLFTGHPVIGKQRAGEQVGGQANEQAGGQAGGQWGGQASEQAGRQAGWQADG